MLGDREINNNKRASTREIKSRGKLQLTDKSVRTILKNCSPEDLKTNTISLLTYNTGMKDKININNMLNQNDTIKNSRDILLGSKRKTTESNCCSSQSAELLNDENKEDFSKIQKQILKYAKLKHWDQIEKLEKYSEKRLSEMLVEGYMLLCYFYDNIQEVQTFM